MFELLTQALRVQITVTPKASRTAIKGVHDGRLKLLVQAPPVDGKANEAVIEFFAEVCAVPKRAISIECGDTSRRKTVKIETADPQKVLEVLRGLTPGLSSIALATEEGR